MLQRPRSRLPRNLRRKVSPSLRAFVRKRHERVRGRSNERWRRSLKRSLHGAEQTLKLLRRFALWIALGTGALVFGVLVFSPLLQVREIRVQRSEMRVDIERVQEELLPLFGKHLLFLSERDVAAPLAANFPDFDSAIITKHYPSQLVVQLKLKPILARLNIQEPPAPPVAAASGSAVPVLPAVRRGVDYLTTNGIYVILPTTLSGTTTLNVVDWSLRPSPNTRLFTEDFLTTLKAAEDGSAKIMHQAITKRTVFLRAREFQLQFASGITLWFDTRSPLKDQLQRLTLFLRATGPGEAKRYVDLRLAGKVVYR